MRHLAIGLLLGACGGDDSPAADGAADTAADTAPDTAADVADSADSADTADTTTSTCPLAANTSVVATSDSGCALLARDTNACRAEREAAGLSGIWLEVSCRVALTRATDNGVELIRAEADGQPDYPSFYFAASDPCYEAYPEGQANPNEIVAATRAIDFPVTPDATTQTMGGGIVGMALNGVPIFGNFAAPGDDIFLEFDTFDRCGAHPSPNGVYHYHGEPLALSHDDARLIGILRDGYPVYGRRDPDGSTPTLDAAGGHTSASGYHYHVNEQVSSGALTGGQRRWFLTTGTYHGRPAACSDCR